MDSAEYQGEDKHPLDDARADAEQVYNATAGEHMAAIDRCRRLGQRLMELRIVDSSLMARIGASIVSGRMKLEYARVKQVGKRMREADDYRNAVIHVMGQFPNAE